MRSNRSNLLNVSGVISKPIDMSSLAAALNKRESRCLRSQPHGSPIWPQPIFTIQLATNAPVSGGNRLADRRCFTTANGGGAQPTSAPSSVPTSAAKRQNHPPGMTTGESITSSSVAAGSPWCGTAIDLEVIDGIEPPQHGQDVRWPIDWFGSIC